MSPIPEEGDLVLVVAPSVARPTGEGMVTRAYPKANLYLVYIESELEGMTGIYPCGLNEITIRAKGRF